MAESTKRNPAEIDRRIEDAESVVGVTLSPWQRDYAHDYVRALLGEGELPVARDVKDAELLVVARVLNEMFAPSAS